MFGFSAKIDVRAGEDGLDDCGVTGGRLDCRCIFASS